MDLYQDRRLARNGNPKKELQYYTYERIIMQHKGGTAAWNKSMRGKPFSEVMD
jgi:hypothetical protein